MKNYEISFIVRPDLEKDAVDKIAKDFENVLVKNGANILNSFCSLVNPLTLT